MSNKQLIHSNAIQALKRNPNKIAAIHRDATLTYGRLFSKAQVIAENIKEKGVAKDLIAVILDKGVDQIVANLGVVLSGCSYFPVDPTWPENRIRHILKTSTTKVIIGDSSLQFEWLGDYAFINIKQSEPVGKPTQIKDDINSSDLAYVIFTSGSTGTPKGVAIEHYSVYNTIKIFNETFSVNETDSILSLSPVSFDLSVYDIFGLLNAGGTIIMPDPTERNDPKCWLEYLDKFDITVWNTAPALGQMLVDYIDLTNREKAPVFPKVKLVALGGDWVPLDLPDRLRKVFPNATLMSGGGSTETSIWGCWYIIKDVSPNWKSIPYGKAIQDQNMQVLSENFICCDVGEIGEIYFSGIGLAREYWQAPELTAQKFVFHPKTHERFYKSGDLGRLLPDGNIEFVSRIDQQVQINGYRVELPEIEKHLKSHLEVDKSVVLGLETSNHSMQLAAAVVIKSNGAKTSLTSEEVRMFLAKLLPNFMVPNIIVVLDKLPLSKHGKIDKLRLKSLFKEEMLDLSKPLIAPVNDIEKNILLIWEEVLGHKNISTDDTFLSLGGTSVLAVAIIAKIENKYSIYLPVGSLLNKATVKSISAALSAYKHKSKELLPILINKNIYVQNHDHLPLFLIHPGGGMIICYDKLGSCISNRQIYGIEFPYNEVKGMHETPYFKLEWLADLYTKKIMSITSDPCLIGGWSAGGAISYAVTKRMEKLGGFVPLLVMIDSACANVYRAQKNKIAKVNYQALTYYINELNKHFTRPVLLEELKKNKDFDLNMYLPDLIHFTYEQLNINDVIKKEIPVEVLDRFNYTIEGVIRAGLDAHVSDSVERILFIKAGQSDISTARGWMRYSRQKMYLHEMPDINHLEIVADEHVEQLKQIITSYTKKLNV